MQPYHLAVLTRLVLTLYKGREDEEEEVSSYWVTLKEKEDIGTWKVAALFLILWKIRSGRGCKPVARQTT